MHPTLQAALTIAVLYRMGRYPTQTRILGPNRKERDTDTSNRIRSPRSADSAGSPSGGNTQ